MEARDYLDLLRRRWLLLIVTVIVGLAAGWVSAPSGATAYRSTAELFVDPHAWDSATNGSATATADFDQLLESYCALFPSASSAQDAGLSSSAVARSSIKAAVIPNSDLLYITVTDPSSSNSQRVTNAMAAELARTVSSGKSGLTPEPATVVTPATTVAVPPPSNRRGIAEGGILGLVAGLALIIGVDVAQGFIRRPEAAAIQLGLPVLALVPRDPGADEALRFVGAEVAAARSRLSRPVVMVSSGSVGEGTTTVFAGLARALASAGYQVALVDLDYRNPSVHTQVGGNNEMGSSDVLAGRMTLEEAWQAIPVGAAVVKLLAAGETNRDPGLLLMKDRLVGLLQTASDEADLVLVNAPALLLHAESLAIAAACGAAVLVAEARRRALPHLERAREMLVRSQTEILGVVLDAAG